MSEVLTFLSGLFLLLLGLGVILLGFAIIARVIGWFSPEAKEARAVKVLDKLCAENPHLERRIMADEHNAKKYW